MSASQILLAGHGQEDQWLSEHPNRTYFEVKYEKPKNFMAYSYEVPFDQTAVYYGDTSTCRLPTKGDFSKRFTLRSILPALYEPLGPGYVYPLYTDKVNGAVYVPTGFPIGIIAIQPGDFVGYFNTQFQIAWTTNFVGTANIDVAYDASLIKFVFTSTVYEYIYFPDDMSGVFWGFDPRSFDFVTTGGFKAYRFVNGVITPPFTLYQAGWIRGFTPPPEVGFSYVESVACRLVKSATLLIGSQTIDKLTSERLIIEDDLGVAYENQAGLTILEGKNDTSPVYAPREYYTRLTFNTDKLNMKALYNQDVRIDIEYEKFENLPSNLITTNGFLDGASYVTSNLQAITADGINNFNVQSVIGWKNYVIMGPLQSDASFRFYNEDTGTFYKWTPGGSYSGSFITVNGGTIYRSEGAYLKRADLTTVLGVSTTPWTTSTVGVFSAFPVIPYGDANNTIITVLSDARYVYLQYAVNYYIIGSTFTSLVSGTVDGTQTIWTVTYRFYNKTAPLSPADQAALQTFWATYGSTTSVAGPTIFPSSSVISSMTQVGSYVTVVGTLTYATATLTGAANIPGNRLHTNLMWLRYDSFAGFNTSTSYSYPILPSGLPASVKDIFPGIYDDLQLTNTNYYFKAVFDGRYIYFPTAPPYIARLDTQNFTSPGGYSQTNAATLSPNPLYNSLMLSDGRYLYMGSSSVRGSNGTFSRYDTTQSIFQQSSWEYFTGDTLIRANDFEFSSSAGFDGKYMYFFTQFVTQSVTFPITDFSRVTTWHKYDTTKPFNDVNSWEWIDFRPDGTINASDGSHPNISLLTHRTNVLNTDPTYRLTIQGMRFVVGSRYIYIVEFDDSPDANATYQDFIQYNPLTMAGTLTSSMIIKYETFDKPAPQRSQNLYGQTIVNDFTILQGQTEGSFRLDVRGPVREFWITVDSPGVINHVVFRLNNEILVDDDQIMTRYIRTFEAHTSMPSSSNVCVYSVSWDPERLSPSGTVNMSRVAEQYVDVTLVSAAPSNLKLQVFSKVFNVLAIQGGIGGLIFDS
jgi:hypothetical protein